MIEIPRHPHALRSGISIAVADPARKHSAASAPCLFVNQSPLTAGLELIADGISKASREPDTVLSPAQARAELRRSAMLGKPAKRR